MRIWIIKTGEPLPAADGSMRLMRASKLAATLAAKGHQVTYWASTFDHHRKRHIHSETTTVDLGPNQTLICLHGPPYRRNISFARLRNHRVEAAAFLEAAASLEPPDIIVSCLPTLDLCDAATKFGRRVGAPVVIDVRDMWPEMYTFLLPPRLRKLGRLLLFPFFAQLRRIIRAATGVTGVSDEFVRWALRQGGRTLSIDDAVFRSSYQSPDLTESQRAEAGQFWKTLGLGGGERILCYVGSLTKRASSSLVDVVKLFGAGAQDLNGWRLVICGDGDLKPVLEAEASPSVTLTGWIGQSEIVALLEQAELGLIPYPNEPDFLATCPNKFGEYLSAGTPVLSHLGGEVGRMISEHHCGFTYTDAGEIAPILKSLTDEPDRRNQRRANAKRLYCAEFDADVVYATFAQHIEQVASRHRREGQAG